MEKMVSKKSKTNDKFFEDIPKKQVYEMYKEKLNMIIEKKKKLDEVMKLKREHHRKYLNYRSQEEYWRTQLMRLIPKNPYI